MSGTISATHSRQWLELPKVLLVASLTAILYSSAMAKLGGEYTSSHTFSYVFPVILLVCGLFYQRRKALFAIPRAPQNTGLWLIALASLAFLAGTLAAELFVTRLSLLLLAAGFSWTFWGFARTRLLLPLLALLASALPWPAILYNAVANPIENLLAKAATALAQPLGVNLYSDGSSIVMPNLSLTLADLCDALRCLPPLLIAGWLLTASRPVRLRLAALALASFYLFAAIGARILATAALADGNPDRARDFYAALAPWAVFLPGLALLWLAARWKRRAS